LLYDTRYNFPHIIPAAAADISREAGFAAFLADDFSVLLNLQSA